MMMDRVRYRNALVTRLTNFARNLLTERIHLGQRQTVLAPAGSDAANSVHGEPHEEYDAVLLDVLGILAGTDKASLRGDSACSFACSWDYLRHYGRVFYRYRDKPTNILEIGVYKGASLQLWERYFQRATVIGVDVDPQCEAYAGAEFG
jgi:hypothetical protein